MPITQDIVWAMHQRSFHNKVHKVPMDECTDDCVKANEIITEDNEQKHKGE